MDSANSSPIRNQKYSILAEIKRSNGLAVGELAERMQLSYMGVKQHCNSLEKEGYLSTRKRQKGVGRPEKVYVLTEKAEEFFPRKGTPFVLDLLESVEEVYGPLAAERLLHRLYRRRTEALRPRVRGATLTERARQLVAAREQEGYMSRYESGSGPSGEILEFHSPILEILDRFPRARDFERRLFEELLEARVEREEDRSGGGLKVVFRLFGPEEERSLEAGSGFAASSGDVRTEADESEEEVPSSPAVGAGG